MMNVQGQGSPTLLNLDSTCGKAFGDEVPEGDSCGCTQPSIFPWVPIPKLEPADLDESSVEIPWTCLTERDVKNTIFMILKVKTWETLAQSSKSYTDSSLSLS